MTKQQDETQQHPVIALDVIDWTGLRPHAERGGLFIVRSDVDLLEVARAVRDDDLARVEHWLADGSLARPVPAQLAAWDAAPGEARFVFAILQPWVLAQPQ